jgi:hypothetical protein
MEVFHFVCRLVYDLRNYGNPTSTFGIKVGLYLMKVNMSATLLLTCALAILMFSRNMPNGEHLVAIIAAATVILVVFPDILPLALSIGKRLPETQESATRPPDSIVDAYLPQDTPLQVQTINVELTMIPKHTQLTAALESVSFAARRRPTSLAVAMATIEKFLVIHESLTRRRRLPQGNTLAHTRVKHLFADMFVLRTNALDQLESLKFEHRNSRHVQAVEGAIAFVRDYCAELYASCVARWVKAIPDLGNGMPPFGTSLASNSNKIQAHLMYTHDGP